MSQVEDHQKWFPSLRHFHLKAKWYACLTWFISQYLSTQLTWWSNRSQSLHSWCSLGLVALLLNSVLMLSSRSQTIWERTKAASLAPTSPGRYLFPNEKRPSRFRLKLHLRNSERYWSLATLNEHYQILLISINTFRSVACFLSWQR